MKQRFNEILKEMAELHEKKNKDYAGDDYLSNFKMSEGMGIPAWKGVIVRMTDKLSRIMNLAKSENAAVASETTSDTLTDLAIYAILARMLIEESQANAPVEGNSGKTKRARNQKRRRKSVNQVADPPPEGASMQAT